MSHNKAQKPLKLIPLDEMKKALAQVLTVSKDDLDKAEAERPKRKRQKTKK